MKEQSILLNDSLGFIAYITLCATTQAAGILQ